ncbi:MAG: hypothetical protein J7559_10150, partial [Cohnella sp.]|nr:hypothetical protein [Cohnella sp.]
MSINRAEMKTMWTVLAALCSFVILQAADRWLEDWLEPIAGETANVLLDSFGFAVCFAILTLGWMVFVPTLCRQRLMTAALFAGVGLLDLLQALSGQNMPLADDRFGGMPSDMLGWISQWTGAVGLLIVFSMKNGPVKAKARRYTIIPVILIVSAIAWGVFSVESWNEDALRSIQPYQHVSVLLLYAAAASVILYRHRIERPQSMLTIVQALIWLSVSKLEQALGSGIGDIHYLFAGCIKVVGYYHLLKGIYFVLIEEPY